MSIPVHRPWGKIIGGALGLCLGPWGGVMGLIVGHIHDLQRENGGDAWGGGLWGGYGDFAANVEQAAFTMGVIVLGAKMAKADGRVTRVEIEAFKRAFHIAPAQEAAVGRLFDRARLSAGGFEPYAFQLAQIFRNRPAVLEEVLSGLFIIAAADGAGLSAAEISFLKRVGFIFGFDAAAFDRIAARAGVHTATREKPINIAHEPYAILGVAESASAEEIKIAYRALIREHHPDRLMAQGMPPEFVATATEKMKRINAAYDAVGKMKREAGG